MKMKIVQLLKAKMHRHKFEENGNRNLFLMSFAICSILLFGRVDVVNAADYYVATWGVDAINSGTFKEPWQYPSYAAQQAQAGDTIYLIDDPDDPTDGIWYDEHVVFANSGTPGNPITMTAYNGTPTLDGMDKNGIGITIGTRIGSNARSYIDINGLTITKYYYGIFARGGDNIHVSDCEIYNTAMEAIIFWDFGNSSMVNCHVHDNGHNSVGIYATNRESRNVLIKNCKIHDNPGISGGAGYNLIDLFPAEQNIYDVNIIGNTLYNGTNSSTVFQHSRENKSLYNIKIKNNLVYNNRFGIRANILINSEISNNTIYNCTNGILADMTFPASVMIKNNIITNNNDTGILKASSSNVIFYLSYNNVWGNTDDYVGISPGAGDISLDPLFANPANGDFHLKSTAGRWAENRWITDDEDSPCIDAGKPSSDYSREPDPNGRRINIGTYGNTVEASKSYISKGEEYGEEETEKSENLSLYPNPYITGKGYPEKIIFVGLPKDATLRIYTVSAELLKIIDHKDIVNGGLEEWDISEITSGVYIYFMDFPSGEKKGKVSIIK